MKYFNKNSHKEVKIGDTMAIKTTVDTIFGPAESIVHITVTQDNVNTLVEHGILEKEGNPTLTIEACVEAYARKLQLEVEHVGTLIEHMIDNGMYSFVLQIFLKGASELLSPPIEMVKGLSKVFVISLIDARIYDVPSDAIQTYEHFAYFVSRSQAKQVKRLLKELFAHMYGEQENSKRPS
jgi:hypothetical protein